MILKSLFKKGAIVTFLMGGIIIGSISSPAYANETDSTNQDY